MIRVVLLFMWALVWGSGCSSHTPDPNERMMDKVVGELDRETSK
ncbi:MAG: hypothetical protein AB7U44_06070 [Sulfuricurvum sp.]|jgi:hypothetical protein|nr:hypothetical protein [Sulfuricurvum sp.]MDD3595016.1 hypothetical protein [Sulfuricurvum sp.]MDD4885071.1 hypothetical protein [Sulfuricurvum sp.]